MAKTIVANLGGGDAVTADNDLIYKVYGDLDGYTTAIDTFGSHTNDADVTVSAGLVTITNVAEGSNASLKITSLDEAGNESAQSDAYSLVEAEYQTYLDRLTTLGRTLPSAGQRVHQNQLVIDLKASGAWAKADAISLFATDAGADSSRVNLYPPASFENVISGTVTYTSNVGFKSNGTDGQLTLGMNISTETTNFLQNSCCVLSYHPNGTTEGKYMWGALDTGSGNLGFHLGDNLTNRVNSTTTHGTARDLTNNFVGMKRDDNAGFQVIDGATIYDHNLTSVGLVNKDHGWIGRTGSTSGLPTSDIAFGYIGGLLTPTEIADVKTAIETYMAAI